MREFFTNLKQIKLIITKNMTSLNVKNYTWRSDLSKTEILNEKQFVEYTKEGYTTAFTVTVAAPAINLRC